MRNPMVPLLVALCLTSSAATAQTQPRIETGFLDRSVSLGGQTYKYQIFVPPAYTPRPIKRSPPREPKRSLYCPRLTGASVAQ